eukprot:5520749-Prymnesium_polylepis.1
MKYMQSPFCPCTITYSRGGANSDSSALIMATMHAGVTSLNMVTFMISGRCFSMSTALSSESGSSCDEQDKDVAVGQAGRGNGMCHSNVAWGHTL